MLSNSRLFQSIVQTSGLFHLIILLVMCRWIIDPALEITVPAKRTPWPDAPPELPYTDQVVVNVIQQDQTEKRPTKTRTRSKRSSRSKRKHETRLSNAQHMSSKQSQL